MYCGIVRGEAAIRCEGRMGGIVFQVNEQDISWNGFLLDGDAVATQSFVDKAVTATAHDDDDVVEEA